MNVQLCYLEHVSDWSAYRVIEIGPLISRTLYSLVEVYALIG